MVVGQPLAMALDRAPTIAAVRKFAPRWGNAADWDQTIALCGADFPHFNSGVIYWESTSQARDLFSTWEKELERYRATDQAPLLRAIHLSRQSPMRLPSIYNFALEDSKTLPVIRHFVGLRPDQALEKMLRVFSCRERRMRRHTYSQQVFSRTAVSDTD
jgi:hypothetical protein